MKEKSYDSSTLLVPELADVMAAKDLGGRLYNR